MSKRGSNRPAGRGKRGSKKLQRAVPAVREIRTSDRVLWDARKLIGDVDALEAEVWASGWLGAVWEAAGLRERAPELRLCTEVADLVRKRPTAVGVAAVSALRRVAPEEAHAALGEVLDATHGTVLGGPAWIGAPAAEPVRAWRAVDVWDSRRVFWVEFATPRPHTVGVWTMTSRGPYVTAIGAGPPGGAQLWAEEREQPTPMPLVDAAPAEVLGEIADALRRSDMSWPRPEEESYAEWRMLAWARCRRHLADFPDWEPMPDGQRTQLVDDFIAAGAPDDDVTRSVADLFLDYGDGYISSGQLCWSPTEVELFLADWLPRKAVLDIDQRAALPDLLRRWVRFCLERRGLDEQWIEPVLAEIDECLPEFEAAFDDESAWGPAKQLATELAKRGVDMSDEDAVEEAMSALNAERLARSLLDDSDE